MQFRPGFLEACFIQVQYWPQLLQGLFGGGGNQTENRDDVGNDQAEKQSWRAVGWVLVGTQVEQRE